MAKGRTIIEILDEVCEAALSLGVAPFQLTITAFNRYRGYEASRGILYRFNNRWSEATVAAQARFEELQNEEASYETITEPTIFAEQESEYPEEQESDIAFDATKAEVLKAKPGSKTFIFSGVQAGASINYALVKCLECLAKDLNAELFFTTVCYHKHEDDIFKNNHRLTNEFRISDSCRVVDFGVSPSNMDPLVNKAGRIDGVEQLFVSHTKLALGVTTRPLGKLAFPYVQSTGVVTLPDYKKTDNGALSAKWHHMGGALVTILDTDEGPVHDPHQLTWCPETESIMHVGTEYFADGTIARGEVAAISNGDEHAVSRNEVVFKAVTELTQWLGPKMVFRHDYIDHISANPHLDKGGIAALYIPDFCKTMKAEHDFVQQTLKADAALLPSGCRQYIVESNHNEWGKAKIKDLASGNPDATNFAHIIRLAFYLTTNTHVSNFNPVQHYIDPNQELAFWGSRNSSYKIKGIEHAWHGDRFKGFKVGVRALAKEGKMNIGHIHTSLIYRGVWASGCLTNYDLGYNQGPSNWTNSITITYANGTRQIVHFYNGVYCGHKD